MNTTDVIDNMIENEKLLRQSNERAQKYIKDGFTAAQRASTPIYFYCECSHTPCDQRIMLTEDDYEAIHKDRDRFIVIKGHEIPLVEKISKRRKDFYIIEKYALKS